MPQHNGVAVSGATTSWAFPSPEHNKNEDLWLVITLSLLTIVFSGLGVHRMSSTLHNHTRALSRSRRSCYGRLKLVHSIFVHSPAIHQGFAVWLKTLCCYTGERISCWYNWLVTGGYDELESTSKVIARVGVLIHRPLVL
jgi:hypothetical protein